MKNLLSACFLVLSLLASKNAGAQQNITYVISGKTKIQTAGKTIFMLYLKGFTDQKQADAFYDKMRALPDVSSVRDMGKDANDIYTGEATLKSDKPGMSPADMVAKAGVTHVQKGRTIMTIAEWKNSKHGGEPAQTTK